MSRFVRPPTSNNPNIYYKFEARDVDDKIVKYQVQDFPVDRYEEGIQFMLTNFFDKEPMCATRNIRNDESAVKEVSKIWIETLAKGFSLVCFKENSDELIDCVNPAYTGRGIATEMLKARVPLLKALGLKVTSTAFSGPAPQTAALKAGYQENFVISYDDLHKVNPEFSFPGIKSSHFKSMSLSLP